MPHLGKTWPRQFKNFFHPIENPHFPGPTRKGKLLAVGTGFVGTVAELWEGTTTISSVAEYWSTNKLWSIYTFENPTDSQATVDVRVLLVETVPHPNSGIAYRWQIVYEAYYAGVFLGRKENNNLLNGQTMWTNPHSDSQVSSTWNDRTDIPKWDQASFRFGAANWADQPEFHPYRHEP